MVKKLGFTAIEILIAASISAVFFLAVYKIYKGITDSVKQTQWSLAAQQQARNGLTFIREEMQRASYKSTVSISGVTVVKQGFKFKITGNFPATSDQELANWTIGIPWQTGVADGAVMRCSLALENGKLVYSRFVAEGSTTEPTYNKKVLMENVASVTLIPEDFDPDAPTRGKVVHIFVELRHPDRRNFPNTFVKEQTGAKVEVEFE